MDQLGVERLVRRHGGVVRREQLYALDVSPRSLTRLIRAGIWRAAGPGILAHHSAEPGLATATRVAALWVPGQALTGTSAALLRPHPAWAEEDLGTTAMVIGPSRSGRPWRGVRHPGSRSTTLDGFTLADPFSTLVDLLRFADSRTALSIGASALRTGLTTVDQLVRRGADLRQLLGVQQLRAVTKLLAAGPQSIGEVDFHAGLNRAGITGWVANLAVEVNDRTYVLDVAFPAERVYVEFDGVAVHHTREAFENDRIRQNELSALGWRPIRVTWAMLKHDEEAVMDQIRATLARARLEQAGRSPVA